MHHRRISLVLLLVSVCVMSLAFVQSGSAQTTFDTCPALVNDAINQLSVNCSGLERNTACYAYRPIVKAHLEGDAVPNFTWTADQPELGSRIELTTTEAIQTGAFNLDAQEWGISLLNLEANLPNALVENGVTMVVLGGVEVENGVEPSEALIVPQTGVEFDTAELSDLRNNPDSTGFNSRSLGSIAAGETVTADAVSEDGEWVRVATDDVSGWISVEAAGDADFGDLPVVSADDDSRFTPFQDFYFRNGIGGVDCEEAPSYVFIQGPRTTPVALRVHDIDIEISSSIVLRTLPDGDELGDVFQVIVLSGLLRVYPDTPSEILVPPGFVVEVSFDEFVSLGIEDDADEKSITATFSSPRPLSQGELDELLTLEPLTSSNRNLFSYPVDVPRIIRASGGGGAVSQFGFDDPNALDLAQEACDEGLLDPAICQFLGL